MNETSQNLKEEKATHNGPQRGMGFSYKDSHEWERLIYSTKLPLLRKTQGWNCKNDLTKDNGEINNNSSDNLTIPKNCPVVPHFIWAKIYSRFKLSIENPEVVISAFSTIYHSPPNKTFHDISYF